jgi:hypothetical protein
MFLFSKRKKLLPPENSPLSRQFIDRKHDRINYETPIKFENYETKEIVQGSVHNFSKSGLCIEVEHFPAVGQGALIYMDNYSPNAEGPNSLKIYHVRVRWVKQLCNAKEKNQYVIGVSHCKDIYELSELFGH